jgi:hypothetical protein
MNVRNSDEAGLGEVKAISVIFDVITALIMKDVIF